MLRQTWGAKNQSQVQCRVNLEVGGGVGLVQHVQLQIVCNFRGVRVGLETVGGMAGKNPFGRGGNHSGHPPRRLGGDRGDGSFGAKEVEARENGKGEEDPGEWWFCQENSHAEIYTLSCMEDDLNSALLFEHSGGH